MMGMLEFIKEKFKKKELTKLEKLKIAQERIRKNIVSSAEARDLTTSKRDIEDLDFTIEWMKTSNKIIKKLIKKEEKKLAN